MQESKRVAKSI